MAQPKKNLERIKRACRILLVAMLWNLTAPPPSSFAADAEDASEDLKIDMDSTADTISMSFDGALLKDVLLLFSQQSGLNFIASSDVESKKVTVYFENVSPQDALDSIVGANGLTYAKKQGSEIYIVTAANRPGTSPLVTKVVRLKYVRLSSSPLDVGGAVTIENLKEIAAVTSTATAAAASSATTSEKGIDKLVTKLLTPQGKLTVDTQTNSLILVDTAENIAAIEKVMAEIDVPPSQVILEVRVMEIDKTLASDIGIEWGGTNGALGTLTAGSRTTNFPFFPKPNVTLLQENLDAAMDTPTQPSQVVMGTINASDLTATLHYMESDSKTKILARPRVLTQNNEAAEIKLVTNQTIGVTVDIDTTANTRTETPERADVGVIMRMTPQINEDGSVLLYVEPAVSTSAISTFNANFQDITTRSVRTMARVKNNETLVIGGLINGNGTTAQQKMPFLGSLPAVGRFFRYDAVSNEDRELVVFVTPHIVYGASSLGKHSATALGEDVSLRRVLNEFMDTEMDEYAGDFQDFEKDKNSFFTTDQQFIRDTEKRLSNPLVDKQMTQALDALSPQLIDTQMTQALDTFNTKKYRNS